MTSTDGWRRRPVLARSTTLLAGAMLAAAGSPGMGGPVTRPYTAYTFGAGAVGAPFMTVPAEE